MLGFSSLKRFVTDSLAIDLGSANTIIAVKGREDFLFDEPSLVAVNELSEEIVAFGREAFDMWGREGRNIVIKAPLSGGVVADFELTKQMLAHFVASAKTGGSQVAKQAIMSMISDVTHVEQRALIGAAEEARIGKVFVMEEGLAAAFGADVKTNDRRASAVVDIGAATTNIAFITKGSITHSRSERIGSDEINVGVADHLRRQRGLQVGAETTESLKREFLSAMPPADPKAEHVVKGRDVQTGAPNAVTITAGEIYPIVEQVVGKVSKIVAEALTELRPEVAADVYDRGVILTGGGALLNGFDQHLRDVINLSVIIPDEPRYATVRGLVKMFDEPELLERVSRNDLHVLQNSEIPFEA